MAQPTSNGRNTVRELVQQQRDSLYATGHQNLNMLLSAETIERLDDMKKRFRLRSRDAVVARVITQCMTTSPDAFTQRSADPETTYRRISPVVAGELADYVRRVQLRFRGLAYGPVFEMILAVAGSDLAAPSPAEDPEKEFSARKHEATVEAA